MTWQLLCGDAEATLATLPAESVQCVITSPPYYGLRDYGVDGQIGLEPTIDEYLARLVAVFAAVRRALRTDGTLWVNMGDSYNAYNGNAKQGGPVGLTQSAQRPRLPTGYGLGAKTLKPKDLMMMPARLALALQADGWWLRSDIIWCLSGGTRVYARTQKGEMPMTIKDMVRLDPATVQLWNGKRWTQVLGWSQSARPDQTYEIELRSGERIGCTGGHEWPTGRGLVRADALLVGDVIESCQLPEPTTPDAPAHLPDELGWFVGLYLAEGSRGSGAIQIASHAEEVARHQRLSLLARSYGGTCRMHYHGGYSATINLYGRVLDGIIDTYISGSGAKAKHLTTAVWRRSDAFLRAVLDGYLSGDGHYDAPNDRWRLGFTLNDSWAADLRTLCGRLGVNLKLVRTEHTLNRKKWPGYRGEIRLVRGQHHNNKQAGEVVAIRGSRARKFWDIGVADDPHLFALASGVLTHNSKPNPMPESVTDRPTTSHEHLFLLAKSPRYYYDGDAIREEHEPATLERVRYGGAAAGKSSSQDSLGKVASGNFGDWNRERQINPLGRNRRTVWSIPSAPFPGAHFATFPPALVEPCILAGTSHRGACPKCGAPWRRVVERHFHQSGAERRAHIGGATQPGINGRNGWNGTPRGTTAMTTTDWAPTCQHHDAGPPIPCVVLDCFAGAGTVPLVADRLGRHGIGIELKPEYVEMARKRLTDDAPMFAE